MTNYSNIILELQYLPPLQYFTKFVKYEQVSIEQHENYIKGSYRNRCYIYGSHGPLRLSIPLLKGKNEQQNIREVQIASREAWEAHHWQSIQSAYGNAPFFEFYADDFRPVFEKKHKYLFDLNWQLLELILPFLGLDTFPKLTSEYQKAYLAPNFDFRNGIFPKKHRQKEDPYFQPQAYPQVFAEKKGFVPNLSILDLLFCTGPEAGLILERNTVMTN